MTIYATIYDNVAEKMFDISNVIRNIKLTTYIEDNPGKCTFDIEFVAPLSFEEGASFSLEIDGNKMFRGYVFTRSFSEDKTLISVVAFDQLRYLKNKDSYVFKGMTSDEIFSKICEDFVLRYRVVDKSNYKCIPRSNDATGLYDMIKCALSDTLINAKDWFIIRDNFGVLEHVNIFSLQAGVMIGDSSGLLGFKYETSIDSDTYNQIKLYKDNTKTKKRELYIVNDTINGGANLKKWGILQLYEKVDDNLNIAQIEQKARGMLSLYNSSKKTLKLTSVGSCKIFAGCIFRCNIADLGDTSIDSYMLVTECTHTFDNNEHTMDLTTEVVRNG